MLKTLGIVDACYRLQAARDRACRKLGGKSVLEWVVRRATDCLHLSGVIVVTDEAPENQFIAGLVPLDVPVYSARRPDALGCFAAALEEYPAEAMARIDSGHPFLDPALIDRLVLAAEEGGHDYVSYCVRDGRPAISSPSGMGAEWVARWHCTRRRGAPWRRRTGKRRRATSSRHPEKFPARRIPIPHRIDRDDVRLRVDLEEDWEHALAIFEALGPEELDWQRIAELLDHQPALRLRMAALNRCTLARPRREERDRERIRDAMSRTLSCPAGVLDSPGALALLFDMGGVLYDDTLWQRLALAASAASGGTDELPSVL